ncbi:hypothetical protein WJX73_000688 [Symbiochloris irregularis]|uniref:Uncharacterized protein n=1 Tax=Symbiochloris irregularis TaxID=706552 RepID=A0AAW1PF91_9CHLO
MTITLYNSLPGSLLQRGLVGTQGNYDRLSEDASGTSNSQSGLEDDARKKSMYSAAYPQHPSSAYNSTAARLNNSQSLHASSSLATPWGTTGGLQGSTTYTAEILNSAQTSRRQLADVEDLSCTTVDYTANRHGAAGYSKARTLSGFGAPVGYRTEYESSMGARTLPQLTASSSQKSFFGNSQTLGNALLDPEQQMIKARPQGRASIPFGAAAVQQARTSNIKDYGEPGTDPLSRTAPSARMMTGTASTLDLAAGTTRSSSQRIPGYTGHVTDAVPMANEVTNEAKQPGALLLGLSQYPRERVPGCTKHFPRAACNIREPPASAPALDPDWAQVSGVP